MLKEFNSQSFDAEVLGGQGVALVDFCLLGVAPEGLWVR